MVRSESMKVLLAEDEKKVSHFIRKALREAGYEVETAYEGNQAMDHAGKEAFDVIVLDIMMPGKDGLAVLRRLREEKNATPVMLLTARGEVSQRVEGLELGADDYLAKSLVCWNCSCGTLAECSPGRVSASRSGITTLIPVRMWSTSISTGYGERSTIFTE
jgi:CheY-like chemotaxis protein